MSKEECPRFYANDITSILKERNALKEKVLELEEEIVDLKRCFVQFYHSLLAFF